MDKCWKIGDDVKIHPACAWFMQGVKYGTITTIGRKYITVKALGFNSCKKFRVGTDLLEKIR